MDSPEEDDDVNMDIEEPEGEVACPCCGVKEGECDHLLAVIDRTFGSLGGGYAHARSNEFYKLVETVFRGHLERNERMKFAWLDYQGDELQELWEAAVESWAEDNSFLQIDGDILTRMELQLLEAEGAIECDSECDGGAPGMSSAVSTYFAENPKEVFDNAIILLKEQLASGLTKRKKGG